MPAAYEVTVIIFKYISLSLLKKEKKTKTSKIDSNDIIKQMLALKEYYIPNKGGITISGGEPFDQPEALLELVLKLKKHMWLK